MTRRIKLITRKVVKPGHHQVRTPLGTYDIRRVWSGDLRGWWITMPGDSEGSVRYPTLRECVTAIAGRVHAAGLFHDPEVGR